MDKNHVLALTEDNVKRINFLIGNDSKYRLGVDPNNPASLEYFINEHQDPSLWSIDDLENVIKMIDVQNSTHQEFIGARKNSETGAKNNGGRRKTAEYIYYKVGNWYSRLKGKDMSLVHDIALALCEEDGSGRYTFSFASKFCAYVSRALYKKDYYSPYDAVLARILPYYAWAYLGENKYIARKLSRVSQEFEIDDKKGNYEGYNDLIGSIIEANKTITGYIISRKDFDHLLWYYFKGDWDRKDENKELVHESRTTKALKFVNNEDAILKTCK